MKKTVLLFTILCVSALNGMEDWTALPQDIRYVIINKALETSNSLDGAIAALKNLSVVQGIQFDKLFSSQKDFTKVAHMLADKFGVTTADVVSKFGMPIAKRYLDLAHALMKACKNNDTAEARKLLEQGADANQIKSPEFQGHKYLTESPLTWAVYWGNYELVELLLNNGAKPIERAMKTKAYDELLEEKAFEEDIKKMLEQARQKR